MSEANTVRGEVQLDLSEKSYVLRPEHGRAVRLDDDLPLGILGTLLQMTGRDQVIKLRTMALVVHHLADDRPDAKEVIRELSQENYMHVASVVVEALRRVASGSPNEDASPGEMDAPSSQATG